MDNFKHAIFNVVLDDNIIEVSPVLSKARCRIFYKGANRNGGYITEDFAALLIQTLPYTPVKGIFDKDEEDFTDHGEKRDLGKIYGIVPENYNGAWEVHLDEDGVERNYYCADIYIYTALYEEAKDIVGKSLSLELYKPLIQGDWVVVDEMPFFQYTQGCFLGLQILGDNIEPCFEGAAFYSLNSQIAELAQQIKELFSLIKPMEESKNLNLGEKKEMSNVNFQSSNEKYRYFWEMLNPEISEENGRKVVYNVNEIDENSIHCYNLEDASYVDFSLDADGNLGEPTCSFVHFYATEELKNEAVSLISKGYTLESVKKLEEEIETCKQTIESLENYKKENERKLKSEVISEYVGVLSEEEINNFTANIDNYSLNELDKEMAYLYKTTNPGVFFTPQVPKDNEAQTGISSILNKYNKN